MSWRSLILTTSGKISVDLGSLKIQVEGNCAKVPLEDISVLCLDSSQILLSSAVLSRCMEKSILVIVTDQSHLPSGFLLPCNPHHRALQILKLQIDQTEPAKKRLWQQLVKQKILNQAHNIQGENPSLFHELVVMAKSVSSGDKENLEAQAAKKYWRGLFGDDFRRGSDSHFLNGALNYGYAVLRGAISRQLVIHGFNPLLGLHHNNEQNAFNLADDLIEVYRPFVDKLVKNHAPFSEADLDRQGKAKLVGLLNHDILLGTDQLSILHSIELVVENLVRVLKKEGAELLLPRTLPV